MSSKFKEIKSKIINVIFWSVVSAAFIGPGTITTATSAGAIFQFDLLWSLIFSTFACLLLQEASARVAIYSGMNLGQAIAKQFEGKSSGTIVLLLIIGAIILGSAAYETGNILGSIEGLKLIFEGANQQFLVLLIGIFAIGALNLPSLRAISKFMGIVVMLMGFSFFFTLFLLKPSFSDILSGFIPSIPKESPLLPGGGGGAALLIIALIGTTVVPYDIFLGSGVLEKKQTVKEMRFGLSVAIILGGIISMAVLIVGTIVTKDIFLEATGSTEVTNELMQDSNNLYKALAYALTNKIGWWAPYVLGFGMFAAGFSSAITAPLASAITAKSLFEKKNPKKWKTQSFYFKFIWGGVLVTGLLFGFIGIKPVPAIIFAQALNGLILPFISIFLIFVVNDRKLMGDEGINNLFTNILMGIVVWVTLILGVKKLVDAGSQAWAIIKDGFFSIEVISMITLFISLAILGKIYRNRIIREKDKKRQNNNNQNKEE